MNQSGQAQYPPLRCGYSAWFQPLRHYRASVTSTLLSSARQTSPSGLRPAVKDCFGLHSNSAFGFVAFPGRRWEGQCNQCTPAAINVPASIRGWYSGQCKEMKSGVGQVTSAALRPHHQPFHCPARSVVKSVRSSRPSPPPMPTHQ